MTGLQQTLSDPDFDIDACLESANNWCDLIEESVDQQRADEIIEAVNAKQTNNATVIAVCAYLLGGLLAGTDDPDFPAVLAIMISRAAEEHNASGPTPGMQ